MANKIPCSIIRDLLPLYIENLTEEETNSEIKEHLSCCEDCRKLYKSMKEPNKDEEESQNEVDYLKKVKKKSRRKIILAVAVTCLAFLALAAAKVFVIGTKVVDKPYEALVTDEGCLEVKIFNSSSATIFSSIKTDISGNTATITVREALVSPLRSKMHGKVEVPLEGIDEVRMFGKVIWQNDKVISDFANILYQNKTPYIGSMPKVGMISKNLIWPDQNNISKLHTSNEPYGFEIIYEGKLDEAYIPIIKKNAAILISLVDNMGEVIITEKDDTSFKIEETVINQKLPDLIKSYNEKEADDVDTNLKIKDFSSSPYMVQLLLDILDY